MPTRDSGGSDRRATCQLCSQCETCCQAAMAAVEDTSPRDDSSPPPYELISTDTTQEQQATCRGYNTFADSRPASSLLEPELRPYRDVESAEQKQRDTDWEECIGMAVTAVAAAIIVLGIWYLVFMILNLR
ncbi:hypothetical protein F4809DRAFT_173553 [Biscogniauxia mediterranea]|nr:hypothetical protein F4809DRAFT_173553 [Biscogniauxia mediterranea]